MHLAEGLAPFQHTHFPLPFRTAYVVGADAAKFLHSLDAFFYIIKFLILYLLHSGLYGIRISKYFEILHGYFLNIIKQIHRLIIMVSGDQGRSVEIKAVVGAPLLFVGDKNVG